MSTEWVGIIVITQAAVDAPAVDAPAAAAAVAAAQFFNVYRSGHLYSFSTGP